MMGQTMPRRTALALAFALALFPDSSHAADATTYRATSHRRFNDVAHWTRVFDDPRRAEWQKPEELVRALSISPGMKVADIGAGTGYFSALLSKAVGESGAVFAVEVEPKLVEHLRARAEKEGSRNVVPVLASAGNPRLPAGMIDLVLFSDAYHHVDDRAHYLETVKASLTLTGRIAIVEWKPGRLPVGPQEEEHKIPRDQLIRELKSVGFALMSAPDFLPYQWLLVFGRRGAATPCR
jgi:ubiquinone/menaquinone biosynthesis C-methylase UbiE